MSENVRVTSIARKISRSWFWRLFWILFWVNIVLLVVSLAGYCVSQEHLILGHEWIPGLKRSLDVSPFVQGDLGLSKKFGGTGLGLSICQQLAGLMGGRIGLDSTMGVGTKFNMHIPLKYTKDR